MTETAPPASNVVSPKGKKAKATGGAAAKKPKAAPTHPPVADMVIAAINSLKERNGSSAQAIKKYIAGNYKVDVERMTPFIKKYLKQAVGSGALVQTKGKGASGSFKVSKTTTAKPAAKPKVAKPKAPVEKKPKTEKKTVEKKPKEKKAKAAGDKKEKKVKAPKAAKSPEAATKKTVKEKTKTEKSPKKAKVEKKPKASKVAKPKTPKKKATTPKKAAAKKAAPKN